jgi:hypothetical protein
MFPRARTAAAVAALLLAGAPAAAARPAGALTVGYTVTPVLTTVTRLHWSGGVRRTYRVLVPVKVVFPTTRSVAPGVY